MKTINGSLRLEEIAASISLSEYHFQRLFSRWVGISPKRFLQFLTKEHAKELLVRSSDLLSVAYESGLSGPGRLHDLFVNCEAVTPGEYRAQGAGVQIAYGFHRTPFGECLIGVTERGICAMSFLHSDSRDQALKRLEQNWRGATLTEEPALTQSPGEANLRLPEPAAGCAAFPVPQRHQLPDQGLGGFTAHSPRLSCVLRNCRQGNWKPTIAAGSRERRRPQPDPVPDPLPPGHPQDG
jgi:AraC-like DNA-binding protein